MPQFENYRRYVPHLAATYKDYYLAPKDVGAFFGDLERSGESVSFNNIPLNEFSEFQEFLKDYAIYKSNRFKTNLAMPPPSIDKLFYAIFNKFPENISQQKQELYKQFFLRYFNQSLQHSPGTIIMKQVSDQDMILVSPEWHVNVVFSEEALYLNFWHGYRECVINAPSNIEDVCKKIEAMDEQEKKSFVIEAKTVIEIKLCEEKERTLLELPTQWEAQVKVIKSEVMCKEQYKKYIDERNFVQKIIDWILHMCGIHQDPTHEPILFQSSADDKSVETTRVTPTPKPHHH